MGYYEDAEGEFLVHVLDGDEHVGEVDAEGSERGTGRGDESARVALLVLPRVRNPKRQCPVVVHRPFNRPASSL